MTNDEMSQILEKLAYFAQLETYDADDVVAIDTITQQMRRRADEVAAAADRCDEAGVYEAAIRYRKALVHIEFMLNSLGNMREIAQKIARLTLH